MSNLLWVALLKIGTIVLQGIAQVETHHLLFSFFFLLKTCPFFQHNSHFFWVPIFSKFCQQNLSRPIPLSIPGFQEARWILLSSTLSMEGAVKISLRTLKSSFSVVLMRLPICSSKHQMSATSRHINWCVRWCRWEGEGGGGWMGKVWLVEKEGN